MFKMSLFCICATMICGPLTAEDELAVDAVEFEAYDEFDMEDDEDYLLDELAYMDDEMYDDIYFDDEDEFDAMTATEIDELEVPVDLAANMS